MPTAQRCYAVLCLSSATPCCPGCDSPRTGVQILVDTLEAVAPEHQALVRRAAGSAEASAVDAHAVALFLYAQLYIRQARPGRYPYSHPGR